MCTYLIHKMDAFKLAYKNTYLAQMPQGWQTRGRSLHPNQDFSLPKKTTRTFYLVLYCICYKPELMHYSFSVKKIHNCPKVYLS